jgi:hypothetical protein
MAPSLNRPRSDRVSEKLLSGRKHGRGGIKRRVGLRVQVVPRGWFAAARGPGGMMDPSPRRREGLEQQVKTYRGIREPICHVRVLNDAANGAAVPSNPALPPALPPATPPAVPARRERDLAVPRELVTHALGPFDWGADGPGTHYLAIALLADLLGIAERSGIKAMLPFMRRFLARLPKEDFEISDTIFRAFLAAVTPATSAAMPALPGKPGAPDGAQPELRDTPGRKESGQRAAPGGM